MALEIKLPILPKGWQYHKASHRGFRIYQPISFLCGIDPALSDDGIVDVRDLIVLAGHLLEEIRFIRPKYHLAYN